MNVREGKVDPIQIFVSYSHRDEDYCDWLVAELQRGFNPFLRFMPRPFQIWRDKESIKPGRPWRESIIEGIQQSQILLVLVPEEHSIRVALECGMAFGAKLKILAITKDTSLLSEYGLDHLQALRQSNDALWGLQLEQTLLDSVGKRY